MLLIVQHAIFVALKISVVISASPLKQYPTRVNTIRGDKLINMKNPISNNRPRGPTDKASDYESGDSRFESWRGRFFFKRFIARDTIFFFQIHNNLVPKPFVTWLITRCSFLIWQSERCRAGYNVFQTTCDECMNQLFMLSMQSLDTYFLLWLVL